MKEIDKNELQKIEGGIPFLAAALLGGLIYDIISDPGACANGFKDGWNS